MIVFVGHAVVAAHVVDVAKGRIHNTEVLVVLLFHLLQHAVAFLDGTEGLLHLRIVEYLVQPYLVIGVHIVGLEVMLLQLVGNVVERHLIGVGIQQEITLVEVVECGILWFVGHCDGEQKECEG